MIQSLLYTEAGVTGSDYALAPDVLFLRVQDGSARLLDLGGNFYALSQTGAYMLYKTLEMGRAAAAVSIAAEYRINVSQIQHDLSAFLRDLEKKQLLVSARSRRGHPGKKNRLISLVLAPFFYSIACSLIPQRHKAWILLMLANRAIRLFGWPETVACWQSSLKSARLRASASGGPVCLWRTVQEIDTLVCSAASHHLFPVACKERALSCWWLLCATGLTAELVVGIRLFPLECHCWCEADRLVVSDTQDRCQQFLPILRYGNEPGKLCLADWPRQGRKEGLCE